MNTRHFVLYATTLLGVSNDGRVVKLGRHSAGFSSMRGADRITVMPNVIARICFALGVVGLSLGLSGCGYNTIPTLQEQAKARWADVQNQYQRRADLIPRRWHLLLIFLH